MQDSTVFAECYNKLTRELESEMFRKLLSLSGTEQEITQ